MKLSEYKGEEALDVLADIIEPISTIAADKEISDILRGKGVKAKAISLAIRNHKNAVMEIMAALERESVSEFSKKVTVLTLPLKLLDIINDPEMIRLFQSQGQTGDADSSGSVSENTEE